MEYGLTLTELPVRLRSDRLMDDEELARFGAANEPLRVERDSNGELVIMSPTWTELGEVESKASGYLFLWTLADGRGKYYGSSSGFTLPDTSLRSADGAWLSLKHWDELSAEQCQGYAKVCPEFIMEVRSATDRLPDLRQKMESWISNGAELGWLIDPLRRVIEVYRPGAAPEVLENPSSVQGTGCVAGFELVMERIWGSE